MGYLMPHVAYYQLLADNKGFSLEAFVVGSQHQLTFNPTNDIVLDGELASRPILSYVLDPSDNTTNLQIEVGIKRTNHTNLDKIRTWTLSGTALRTPQDSIPRHLLETENNTIVFRVVSGVGAVWVRNVSVHYHRDI